jgi:hypothetical protein
MLRLLTASILAAAIAAPAAAQNYQGAQSGTGIDWQRDVQGAIELARKTDRPLMIYIVGSSDDRPEDAEKAQRRSFRDPTVLKQSKRFIPVRLAVSQHKDLLQGWQMSGANLDIVFVRPDGSKIDQISPVGAGQPSSFVQKMGLVFNEYRNELFAKNIKPVLENPNAAPKDLKGALDRISDFSILGADTALVALLERPTLELNIKNQVYKVLAELSTPAAVEALMKATAAGDQNASKALADCTPAAAEVIAADLGSQDAARHLLAYKTVTKICRIKNVKPDRFWDGTNQRVKDEEIERVRKEVSRIAARWKEQNEFR